MYVYCIDFPYGTTMPNTSNFCGEEDDVSCCWNQTKQDRKCILHDSSESSRFLLNMNLRIPIRNVDEGMTFGSDFEFQKVQSQKEKKLYIK